MSRELNTLNARFAALGQAARSAFAAFGVGLGALGIGRVASDIRQMVTEVSELGNAARNIGVGSEALQELGFAASQAGSNAAQIQDALTRLTRRAGLFAQDGGGPAARAFEELNLQVVDAGGSIRDTESLFNEAVRALGELSSEAERAALASQLFGEDAGPRLNQLLSLGIDGIEDLRDIARSTGAVLSEELVDRAIQIDDEWTRVATTFRTEVRGAILSALDALGSLVGLGEGLPFVFGAELEQARAELARQSERLAAMEADHTDLTGAAAHRLGRDIQRLRVEVEALAELDPEVALQRIFDDIARLEEEVARGPGGGGGQMGRRTGQDRARIEELQERANEIQRLITLNEALADAANRTLVDPTDSGSGRGGGTTRDDDATARAQRFIETLDRQVSAVNEQIAALTRSEEQMARWRTTIEQASIIAAENAEITPQQAQEIRNLTDQLAGATRQFEEQRAAMEAANEAAREVEQQNQRLTRVFTNFAQSAITDVDNVGEAFERLAGQLADLILEMTVFEQIRSGIEEMDLFGSGSGGGVFFSGIGDFFGGLFGGLFAEGGRPPLGRASIVGEQGPEWFIPDVAGTIVPMDAIGGGGGPTIVNHIDARGAERGTAIAIEQAVRRAVGESVTAVQQMARAGRMRDMGFS